MQIKIATQEDGSEIAALYKQLGGVNDLALDERTSGKLWLTISDSASDDIARLKDAVARWEKGERPHSAFEILAERKAKLAEAFTAGNFSAAADILLGA